MGAGIAAWCWGGESELEVGAVGASRGHGRGESGGRVDNEEIACGEELRQVTEASVGDAARPTGGDEQTHAVM